MSGRRITWKLKEDCYNPKIQMLIDGVPKLNFASLSESGFGLSSDSKHLALKIIDYLNSLPERETVLYPYGDFVK